MDALLGELNAEQLGEQYAFDELEPSGGLRDDLRFAVLASAVYNSNPYREGSAIQPWQIFRTLREMRSEKPQDVKKVVAMMRAWGEGQNAALAAGTMRHGGEIRR